jgi:hypothetical protein
MTIAEYRRAVPLVEWCDQMREEHQILVLVLYARQMGWL